jgi:hypothetical protein
MGEPLWLTTENRHEGFFIPLVVKERPGGHVIYSRSEARD